MSPLQKRYHDLDALRATAMLLGILLHGLLSFMPFMPIWPAHDINQNEAYGLLLLVIHGFRMPLFFLVSGFFTTMMWRKRGLRRLVSHRFKRIFLPLVLGIAVMGPILNNVGKLAELKEKSNTAAAVQKPSISNAAKKGDLEYIRKYLQEGGDINKKGDKEAPPLHWATAYGQVEAVQFLIDQGAKMEGGDGQNSTALHWAAFLGQAETARALIENGANVDAKNNDGSTPMASTMANKEITAFISAILEVPINFGEVKANRKLIVAMLRGEPAAENKVDRKEPLNLWDAARKGDMESIRHHLDKDADINGRDDKQASPLHWAAAHGQLDAAGFLIERGADMNIRESGGSTPLHWAAFLGQDGAVRLLLEQGADKNARNASGDTPLKATQVDRGTSEFVAKLLEIEIDFKEVEDGRKKVRGILGAKPNHSLRQWYLDNYTIFGGTFILHHLWFLYDLLWLVAGFAIVVSIARGLHLPAIPKWISCSPLRLLWLVPLTFVPQYFMGEFGPSTSVELMPDWIKLAYYGIFFAYGAICFGQEDFEEKAGRFWPIYFAAAVPVLFIGLASMEEGGALRGLLGFSASLYAWLLILGFIGFFRLCCSRENKTIRYVSDSAYWLYLAHLPLIQIIQIWVSDWPLPSIIKLPFVCIVTTGILLLMYEYLVRYTPIGTLLNGKRTRTPTEATREPPLIT